MIFSRSAFWWWEAPESPTVSPRRFPLQKSTVCAQGMLQLGLLCSLSAAPELGCSRTKLSVYMECLERVCHESVANTTNQESWLAGEKTLTL